MILQGAYHGLQGFVGGAAEAAQVFDSDARIPPELFLRRAVYEIAFFAERNALEDRIPEYGETRHNSQHLHI